MEFDMDNAAFLGQWEIEGKRILKDIISHFENQDIEFAIHGYFIHDINGNTIGKAWIE
jgi:hypothetical protein